jgi:uncharacterized protein YjbI with pentapeptide repeats
VVLDKDTGSWFIVNSSVLPMMATRRRDEDRKVEQEQQGQEQQPRERSFIRELLNDWRPTKGQVLWTIRSVIVFVVVLGLLTLIGLPFHISPWDWLDLLIIPVVLALGGYLFTRSENRRAQQIADQRRQDDMLLAYLDQIGQLLLDKDNRVRDKKKGVEGRTLARGRTYAILGRLPGSHKRTLLEFLYASYLIGRTQAGETPTEEQNVVYLRANDLSKADLKDIHLPGAVLNGGNFRAADLSGAFLSGAQLESADLRSANLRGAILQEAKLYGAILEHADLRDADLRHADLRCAKLQQANLEGADLRGADLYAAELMNADLSSAKFLPAPLSLEVVPVTWGQIRRDNWKWERSILSANLSKEIEEYAKEGALITDLTNANLQRATLKGADLRYANLADTDLQGADLTGVNLKDAMERARGASRPDECWAPPPGNKVSLDRLNQAASLKGATMPDGSKHS